MNDSAIETVEYYDKYNCPLQIFQTHWGCFVLFFVYKKVFFQACRVQKPRGDTIQFGAVSRSLSLYFTRNRRSKLSLL